MKIITDYYADAQKRSEQNVRDFHNLPLIPLEEFADKYGLDLHIHESLEFIPLKVGNFPKIKKYRQRIPPNFVVRCHNLYTNIPLPQHGDYQVSGTGYTPELAIINFTKIIQGKKVIIKKEGSQFVIQVPRLREAQHNVSKKERYLKLKYKLLKFVYKFKRKNFKYTIF